MFSALGYTDNGHNMYPTSIEFIGGDELAVVSAFANSDDFVIEEGAADKLSITSVYLSDYSEAGEYAVSYKSANEDIATVDGEGNIIGISAGSTTVTATVSYNGTSAGRTVDVLILPQGSSQYTVIYDLAAVDNFESTTYADTYNFWKYADASSIEINVSVAGRYSIDLGAWQGNITVDGNVADGYYSFPSAGKYTLAFDGEGCPEKITLYGGKELAPMGVKMSISGTVVKVDEIILSDGSSVGTGDAEIIYSIDDFSVAAIDENTGL